MHDTLPDFLSVLEQEGELLRVDMEVSPLLEISAVAAAHALQPAPSASLSAAAFDSPRAGLGGRALLFTNVSGCDFPLAINVFGSYARMEMALGCHGTGGFASFADRIAFLLKPRPPRSLGDAFSTARAFLPLLRTSPRRIHRGRCQEVIRLAADGAVDLSRLPLIKCWPHDGDPTAVGPGGGGLSAEEAGTAWGEGRYITFAGMHTIHADEPDPDRPASHNIGMYRAQLLSPTRLAMHWHMHHDGAAHWRSWKRAGLPMPIAICLGGESVLPYAATAPLPPGISELLMAGFLHGRGIPMVPAATVPLWVPAHSEIVIEGYVDTDCGEPDWDPAGGESLGPGAVWEGPFGDHTGYYSLPDRYPIMEVTAMTHAEDAVFPAIIVGPPPQEDYYLGKATERVFLPLLRTLIPDMLDYHLPLFGCFHNCACIQIDKSYPLQARRVMHAVWGAGQMAWTKMVVVVDADVDVHDEEAVMRALVEHCEFQRDLELVHGPLDILDHAAPCLGAGSKVGFDATRPIPGEEVGGAPIDQLPRMPGIRTIQSSLKGLGGVRKTTVPSLGRGRMVFVEIEKTQAGDGMDAINLVRAVTGDRSQLVIVVDDGCDCRDWEDVFFRLTANCDPGRDFHRDGSFLGIDATRKMPGDDRLGQPVRPYPPMLEIGGETRRWTRRHAGELGLA